MSHSVLNMPRAVRRRFKRIAQRHPDAAYRRRALALLQLHAHGGVGVSAVAEQLCAARSSVQRWRGQYEEFGEAGIAPQPRGRTDWKATEPVLQALEALARTAPADHGYLRSRWSSELLAEELARQHGPQVHATTVRRWLRRLAWGWRRARPTLMIRDPHKSARLRAIGRALADDTPGTEVFYLDEADIDLNPRIGADWMPRGQQRQVPTPGRNRKCYMAGALHARTGRVVWVEHDRKTSLLFLRLLNELRRTYRAARRLVLILDNYIIHKSQIARRWLANNPKFQLLFQPAYHPWVNRIERLWKQLHDNVTRNHHQPTLPALMNNVRRFMRACQPFPGASPALAAA